MRCGLAFCVPSICESIDDRDGVSVLQSKTDAARYGAVVFELHGGGHVHEGSRLVRSEKCGGVVRTQLDGAAVFRLRRFRLIEGEARCREEVRLGDGRGRRDGLVELACGNVVGECRQRAGECGAAVRHFIYDDVFGEEVCAAV